MLAIFTVICYSVCIYKSEVRVMKLEITKEYIIDKNAPTKACHASTLVIMSSGEIGAAWFGGTAEAKDDVDIWFSYRSKSGWSKPVRITADENLPHWNPVLYKKEDGSIVLFFKVGKKIPSWQTYYSVSKDCGRTWSKPVQLVEGDISGGRGPVKNKPIRLSNGRIIAPSSKEQNDICQIFDDCQVFADISDDDMASWKRTDFVERPVRYGKTVQMIQPTLWESEAGKVHMLVRTNSRYIYRSDSSDNGSTWCKAYKTGLFNNNSGIDAAVTECGDLWLVSNPVKENWGERTPLTVVCSHDNGVTWEQGIVLESMPGEYSYPSVIADKNELLITYTWNRKKICFARIKCK